MKKDKLKDENTMPYRLISDEEYEKFKSKAPYNALDFDEYKKKGQVFINSSGDSLSFLQCHDIDSLNEESLNILKARFNLNTEDLEGKFDEATHGAGKEINRICTLISSSLCAFLHFSNVSESNPITINEIEYNEVHFEVKNKVITNSSNMDVVLISKDENKDIKTILFLESKFSEYLDLSEDKKDISSKYDDEYRKFGLFKKYYDFDYDFDKNKWVLKGNDNREAFFEGVKQMISHYIGVENFINDGYESIKKINQDKLKPDCQVLLGEILFSAWPDEYKNYEEEYKKIYEVLNSRENPKENLIVLKNLLTYKELFEDNKDNSKILNEKIRKFYKYDI